MGYVSFVEGNGIFFLTVFSYKINTEVHAVQSCVVLSGWRVVSFQYHSAWAAPKKNVLGSLSLMSVVILQYRLTHLI